MVPRGCGHRVYIQVLSLVANPPAIDPIRGPRTSFSIVVVGGHTVGTMDKTQVLITIR